MNGAFCWKESVHFLYGALAFPEVPEFYGECKRVNLLIVWVCLCCHSDQLCSCYELRLREDGVRLAGRGWVLESENEVAHSCWTLCYPIDCSLSGFSVLGIFQARVLEWVAISFSRGSSRPRDWTQVSCIVGRCFTVWATREAFLLFYPD